jgi:hypothetical protein
MRGRSRFVSLLLLPSAVCFWFLGWLLFWGGSPREPVKDDRRIVEPEKASGLSFVVAVPEKEIAA